MTGNASHRQKKENPGGDRGVRRASLNVSYSLSEAGSDRFLGAFLLSTPMSSWAAGGTATAPLRTIASASSFLLYSLSLPSLSGRTVEPSSEIRANKPRARE